MAIEKQFDEEMGYAASRELPAAVAQYMKATGKTEEQVAQEIINEDPEWLDWTTHTKYPGNSTPEDNGWTDLKKLGLSIGNSWMNHRNNTDPMWRVGLVNAMFGDPSMLGQYYQMQNQNEQNRLNREAQNAYNDYWKEREYADKKETEKKEKDKALYAAKVEYAKYMSVLADPSSKPSEKFVAAQEAERLRNEYPDVDKNETLAQKALGAKDEEMAYQKLRGTIISEAPTFFKTDKEKTTAIADYSKNEKLRQEDRDKLVAQLQSIESEETQLRKAKASAKAAAGGKSVTEGIEGAKLSAKAKEAIKNKTAPSDLSDDVLDEIMKNYSWSNIGEWYPKSK